VELQSDNLVDLSVMLENEAGTFPAGAGAAPLAELVFVGTSPITFVGTSAITWVPSAIFRAAGTVSFSGAYVGFRFSGTSRPFRLTGLAMEVEPQGEWTA
jgi:hypothetical protein